MPLATKPTISSFHTDGKTMSVACQVGRVELGAVAAFTDLTTPSDRKLAAAWEVFKTALAQWASDQANTLPPPTPTA